VAKQNPLLMDNYLQTDFYELIRNDDSIFHFLEETIPDGIWFWDLETPTNAWMNPRFLNHLGFPAGGPIEGTWQNIIHLEDHALLEKTFGSSSPPSAKDKIILRCLKKDRSTVRMYCQSFQLPVNKNTSSRRLLIFHFVTNWQERVNTLTKKKERLELMIQNTTDILVELTAEGEQTFISPIVESYTGYAPEELKLPFSKVIHPDDHDRILKHWQKVLEQPDRVHRDEYRHIHKTKGYVWMEACLKSYLNDPSIQRVICSVRDITERKNAEQAVKESEKQLKQANSTKDKFFSIIAHDLRNPFNVLLGYSNIIINYIEDKQFDKLQEAGKAIKQSAEQGYVLLNNLLKWSRAEQGAMAFKPMPLNIKNRIESIIDFYSKAAREKEITIESKVKSNLKFKADENMLDTIIRNLLSNAIKYSNPGGKIKVSAIKSNKQLTVEVEDEGIGIPEADQAKLFRMDENYTTNGTLGEQGTGLGLILCKEFVEKHNGQINVSSLPGKGTTIWFTLPRAQT